MSRSQNIAFYSFVAACFMMLAYFGGHARGRRAHDVELEQCQRERRAAELTLAGNESLQVECIEQSERLVACEAGMHTARDIIEHCQVTDKHLGACREIAMEIAETMRSCQCPEELP